MPTTQNTTDRYARLAKGYKAPEAEMAEECQRQRWENQGSPFFEGKPPKKKKSGGEPNCGKLQERAAKLAREIREMEVDMEHLTAKLALSKDAQRPAVELRISKINGKLVLKREESCGVTEELSNACDSPEEEGKQPSIAGLNESYWINRFADETGLIFDPLADGFFWFDTGIWQKKTRAEIREELAAFIRETVRKEQEREIKEKAEQKEPEDGEEESVWMRVGINALAKLLSQRGLTPVIDRLTGHPACVKRDAFSNPPTGIILTANGRLVISRGGEVTFDEGDMGRREDMKLHRLPFDYDQEADAPKTKAWLRRIFSEREDDVQAIAKACGASLWGSNQWKKMVVVWGQKNRGKSRLPELIAGLISSTAISVLDTSKLGGQFEVRRFVGKILLTAPDVDADFMSRPYAETLKQLSGFDRLRSETKWGSEEHDCRGDKLIFCTSNYKLRVRPGTDRSAWEERLVYILADGKGYEKAEQDPNFIETYFREEGSGILNFALAGLTDILQKRYWERSESQMQTVADVLESSDSVKQWVEGRVVVTPNSDGVTSANAWADYFDFCRSGGLEPWSQREFERQVYDAIQDATGKTRSGDIRRGDHIHNGWHGIRLADGKRHLP